MRQKLRSTTMKVHHVILFRRSVLMAMVNGGTKTPGQPDPPPCIGDSITNRTCEKRLLFQASYIVEGYQGPPNIYRSCLVLVSKPERVAKAAVTWRWSTSLKERQISLGWSAAVFLRWGYFVAERISMECLWNNKRHNITRSNKILL